MGFAVKNLLKLDILIFQDVKNSNLARYGLRNKSCKDQKENDFKLK